MAIVRHTDRPVMPWSNARAAAFTSRAKAWCLAAGCWMMVSAGALAADPQAGTDFLYFKDERPAAQRQAQADAASQPDVGIFTSPSSQGVQRFLRLDTKAAELDVPATGVFTARTARGKIGFVLDSDGVSWHSPNADLDNADLDSAAPRRDGLKIGLYSRMQSQAVAPPGFMLNAMTASQFAEQDMRVGMEVAYGGFSLEAGLARESGLLAGRASGLDLGLIYRERSWRASLQFSGRVQGEGQGAFIDLRDQFGRAYSVELEASYNLLPGLSVAGGVRHAGYGDRFRLNLGDPINDSLIFMGTALRF